MIHPEFQRDNKLSFCSFIEPIEPFQCVQMTNEGISRKVHVFFSLPTFQISNHLITLSPFHPSTRPCYHLSHTYHIAWKYHSGDNAPKKTCIVMYILYVGD